MDHKAILDKKLDEGEAIGEARAKMEMAKRLLQNGIGMDVIIQSSDLSKE